MSDQRRLISFIEACTNTAVGFVISLTVWQLIVTSQIYPIATSFSQNVGVAAIFTVVSIARGYALRRVFNYYHQWLHRIIP